MKDIKILGLVLVALFLLFFISGGITGMVGLSDVLPFLGDETCVSLTEEQCDKVCGGVVFSEANMITNEELETFDCRWDCLSNCGVTVDCIRECCQHVQ